MLQGKIMKKPSPVSSKKQTKQKVNKDKLKDISGGRCDVFPARPCQGEPRTIPEPRPRRDFE